MTSVMSMSDIITKSSLIIFIFSKSQYHGTHAKLIIILLIQYSKGKDMKFSLTKRDDCKTITEITFEAALLAICPLLIKKETEKERLYSYANK